MRGPHRFRSKQDALNRAVKVHECQHCGCLHEGKKPSVCGECTSGDLLTFDSRGEHRRFAQLKLLMRAGQIKDLRVQVPFPLYPTRDGLTINKTGKPVMRYIADFVYHEKKGKGFRQVVEDFKGHEDHTTDVFKLKKRLIESAYQIQIRITT